MGINITQTKTPPKTTVFCLAKGSDYFFFANTFFAVLAVLPATKSLNFLPAVKAGTFFAAILISAPV
jgi:hypothetical protein